MPGWTAARRVPTWVNHSKRRFQLAQFWSTNEVLSNGSVGRVPGLACEAAKHAWWPLLQENERLAKEALKMGLAVDAQLLAVCCSNASSNLMLRAGSSDRRRNAQ